MKGYCQDLQKLTLDNNSYRKVLYTGDYLQLVLMSLEPRQSIGSEVHGNDQFFRFESGEGEVWVDDKVYKVGDGDTVVVPAGATHNVLNVSGKTPLKLYTIYAPPHHEDSIEFKTKAAADASKEVYNGKPTE